MGHKNRGTYHGLYRVREMPPRVQSGKDGTQIICPFCKVPHPILPGQQSICGTMLKISAVQTVITKHAAKAQKLICLKCKMVGGGDMVKYGSGFIHLEDCVPGTRLLTVMPTFSKGADFVYRLPKPIRALVEKRTGIVQEVQEMDQNGNTTGKILGRFFLKNKKKVNNG